MQTIPHKKAQYKHIKYIFSNSSPAFSTSEEAWNPSGFRAFSLVQSSYLYFHSPGWLHPWKEEYFTGKR